MNYFVSILFYHLCDRHSRHTAHCTVGHTAFFRLRIIPVIIRLVGVFIRRDLLVVDFNHCTAIHLDLIVAVLDEGKRDIIRFIHNLLDLVSVIGFYFKLCHSVFVSLEDFSLFHFLIIHSQDLTMLLLGLECDIISLC